jgi:hypothetical protein
MAASLERNAARMYWLLSNMGDFNGANIDSIVCKELKAIQKNRGLRNHPYETDCISRALPKVVSVRLGHKALLQTY